MHDGAQMNRENLDQREGRYVQERAGHCYEHVMHMKVVSCMIK